ncbi:hypothetical protein JI752_012035 [Lysobacter sp. MMG2]|uniref:hypothetical protein n=1 Tax=Lysobacter sp. MMG2 TaxID=2801338 RepID=UPI001C236312|nr:hypothetical protein [Lysobacter sp. MMG2]MBU8976873.1 hypothetical protein [Lysobacter sp. MMG2]
MSLSELLGDLAGLISLATTDAPDEYPDWLPTTYDIHKSEIQTLWTRVRPHLRNNEEEERVQRQLEAMFGAFEAGNKELGRKIAWDLWNLPITSLK